MSNSKNNRVKDYIAFYEDNLINSVIPFWLKHCPDYDYGGIFTCLQRDGSIYDTTKYIWLQGRAVWMFSRLYNQYEKRPEFLETAELCLDFIGKYAFDENNRFYFSVNRRGKPYEYQNDIYNMAFCMLGYLEYSKAVGNESYYEKAEKLFQITKKQIESPVKISSLPNLMVLADMTVQLFEYNKDKRYLDILSNVLGKINLHYHPVKEVLMENITTDGSDISEWSKGRNFCPGHSIEVAWIVLGILEHLPDSDTEQKMLSVIENSLELGWDKEFEGIRNFLDIEGKPTLCLENDTKLWWPVAESLYAILAAYKKTGEEKWLNWLDKVHNYTVKHFIDQEYGGWFGFCDKYGNLINTSKGSHSKGFFHTPRSLLNCIKLYS